MNILVYDGPGTSGLSLRHTLHTLKTLLPLYSVQRLSLDALLKEPWQGKAAMVVIPGGRDLPYCRDLEGAGIARLQAYVRAGGRYLGVCAGGYFGAQRVVFEPGTSLEVVGDRKLSFFPGTARGCVHPGFDYTSEQGSRAVTISYPMGSEGKEEQATVYYNGGCVFEHQDGWEAQASQEGKVKAMAFYTDRPKEQAVAGVLSKVGQGQTLLLGVHPEYDPILMDENHPDYKEKRLVETLRAADEGRLGWMRHLLRSLSLDVADTIEELSPLGILLTSASPHVTEEVAKSLASTNTDPSSSSSLSDPKELVIKGGKDELLLRTCLTSQSTGFAQATQLPSKEKEEGEGTEKRGWRWPLYIQKSNQLLERSLTPGWDHSLYYDTLAKSCQEILNRPHGVFGQTMLFGPVVTSTQSLLEQNTQWMDAWPTGMAFVAERQMAARGRGRNAWVSPKGCLQFSLILRHPYRGAAASAIFIQYIVSIAVVDAVRRLPGYEEVALRLKWPNDIYGEKLNGQTGEKKWVKLGGVLVQSSVQGDSFTLVVGCGLNVDNSLPTTSINALIHQANPSLPALGKEVILARALTIFEEYYGQFLRESSILPLLPRYYQLWLHSNAKVRLEDEGGQLVRIEGITEDFGMLRTIAITDDEEPTDLIPRRAYTLQPDGNSFDMMHGLIARKAP